MNKAMLACALLASILLLLQGCANNRITDIPPKNFGRLEGRAWCNERYLDMVDEYQDLANSQQFRKQLSLSKAGYIYSVASVLTLQKDNKESEFNFTKPVYLKEVKSLAEDQSNGFQAYTFIRSDPETGKNIEAIIAFRGSDQWRDYFLHNFWIWPIQYEPARNYVKKVASDPQIKDLKIVVTGYSLGGGLAAHVAQHFDTSALVSQAWAFNPTPRMGVSAKEMTGDNSRIYLLASEYEILGISERAKIGADKEHTSEDFGLVKSSSIYSHYRWVLGRQILQYADLAYYLESGRTAITTPPLEILESQQIKACTSETKQKIAKDREDYNKRNTKI